MPEPEDPVSLPDILRRSDRPIVIYQNAPARDHPDVQTSNAMTLISWLALLTVCLGVILFCLWQVFNPGYDSRAFSPIYAEGRPAGLARQIEERRQINARADGLFEHLDALRTLGTRGAAPAPTHPLISDRDGIDALRSRWDSMCANIRARIYDRRVGQLDTRAAEFRRQRIRAIDSAERTRIDAAIAVLQQERARQVELRRIDGDPALRCVRAVEAPACVDSNDAPFCNPHLTQPQDFVGGVG